MDFRVPPPEVVPIGLRAMRAVAESDGPLDAAEREMLSAAQRVFGTQIDIDTLPPITPAETAAALSDPQLRWQLAHGLIVMALSDGRPKKAEAECVRAFAEALEVPLQDISTLEKLADEHFALARLDIARRFAGREQMVADVREKGVGWLARSLSTIAGLREDPELAAPYRALEASPVGSLGRAYFDFVRGNGFTFVGEKHGSPEPLVVHDLSHILSGYGTDPIGEIQVLSFQAGYRKRNPFTYVLFALFQFQLDLRMSPLAPSFEGTFDPEKMMIALQRGAAMDRDLTDAWDWWPVMDRPLEEVRRDFGIPPL